MQFETPTPWDSVRHDYYTFGLAMSHSRNFRPRVLHIGLGETDDWAHDKRYDMMIDALHRIDKYFKKLWQFLENDKQYKGKTSIIITVDHGRGSTEKDWHGHGDEIPEARYIWMAFISPDSKRRGEWKDSETLYQNQIAATLCKLLGFDYAEQNPNVGKPINF
jgi:predicted AlkP superfamily pyrophosphatase or phosphodiesterase